MIELKRVGGNGYNSTDQRSTHQKAVYPGIQVDKVGRSLPVEVVDQLLSSPTTCLNFIMDPLVAIKLDLLKSFMGRNYRQNSSHARNQAVDQRLILTNQNLVNVILFLLPLITRVDAQGYCHQKSAGVHPEFGVAVEMGVHVGELYELPHLFEIPEDYFTLIIIVIRHRLGDHVKFHLGLLSPIGRQVAIALVGVEFALQAIRIKPSQSSLKKVAADKGCNPCRQMKYEAEILMSIKCCHTTFSSNPRDNQRQNHGSPDAANRDQQV